MQSDRSDSSGPITQRVNSLASATDTRGKHRIQAELKRLEQEARFLEEELEQLDKMETASAACKEMLSNVASKPDPLLPMPSRIKRLQVLDTLILIADFRRYIDFSWAEASATCNNFLAILCHWQCLIYCSIV
ncbi:hypothetical protein JCGZ_02252 [Jatropha curcas]|uniref:G protein gamma domain-containing protein n=1 Tax=Jatropha curcas TaxID=180498 RepID=A0A067L861_JATCU|nr:hypothetical protein JCGZ_02252 [Jatropha curcas]